MSKKFKTFAETNLNSKNPLRESKHIPHKEQPNLDISHDSVSRSQSDLQDQSISSYKYYIEKRAKESQPHSSIKGTSESWMSPLHNTQGGYRKDSDISSTNTLNIGGGTSITTESSQSSILNSELAHLQAQATGFKKIIDELVGTSINMINEVNLLSEQEEKYQAYISKLEEGLYRTQRQMKTIEEDNSKKIAKVKEAIARERALLSKYEQERDSLQSSISQYRQGNLSGHQKSLSLSQKPQNFDQKESKEGNSFGEEKGEKGEKGGSFLREDGRGENRRERKRGRGMRGLIQDIVKR